MKTEVNLEGAAMNRREELKRMIAAVDELAEAMKKRLRQKAAQGYHGGLDPSYRDHVAEKLRDHVEHISGCMHCGHGGEKQDDTFAHAVDIANLAMMLGVSDRLL